MENIKEIYQDGERLFIKKSKVFGWSFIKPCKIDGKINWKNLLIGGSWINVIKIVLILLIVAGCVYEYSNAVRVANECLSQSIRIILP